jgi:hypothetical protein
MKIKEIADNNSSISSTRWAFVSVIKFDMIIISVTLGIFALFHLIDKPLDNSFFYAVATLLGILTTYLVKFIGSKIEAMKKENDNELYRKYMQLLDETIEKCVIATNQTYVESLKNKNAFDAEA